MIYLVRHGHAGANRRHEIHGHTDDPLDDEGCAQADALGEVFAGCTATAVYANPLGRALQTAEPVEATLGCGPSPDGCWNLLTRTVGRELAILDAVPGDGCRPADVATGGPGP